MKIYSVVSLESNVKLSVAFCFCSVYIQSTLVISRSKGPSETHRDIRTSTYQIV